MAFATKYRIEFDTGKQNSIRIDLQQDAFAGSITNVTAKSASLVRADGDRDKIVGVRASSLDFSILCNDTLTPDLFFTQSDIETKVLLYFNGVLNWVGWLDSSSFQFPLFDGNIELKLTARDGLHLLDKAKYTDLYGITAWGQYDIITIIEQCLIKTELELDFWTWNDIYHDGASIRGAGGDTVGNNDCLKHTLLDIGTFRTGSDEYDSPLTILEKVCDSFKMVLIQARGEWHFIYIEDWIRNLGLTGTRWNNLGVAQEYVEYEFNEINIGLYQNYKLINADANVSIEAAKKAARVNYAFDVPASKIRNQDFNSGASVGIDPLDAQYERFSLDGWTTSGQVTYAYNYVTDANAVIEPAKRWIQFVDSNAALYSEITSSSILVQSNDNFTISFKHGIRDTVNNWVGKLYFDVMLIKTAGGTDYLGADGKWKTTRQYIQMPNLNGGGTYYTYLKPNEYSLDTTDGINGSGQMYIIFRQEDPAGGEGVAPVNSLFYFIRDLNFDYQALISPSRRDASYYGYTRDLPSGQYYESSINKTTKNEYNQETYLFNSPTLVTRGSMFAISLALIKNWKHRSITESLPFGKLIARAIWKLVYRTFYRIEATSINASASNYLLSNLNTVRIDELDGKIFMISTITIDLLKESAEATFTELLNDDTTDDFDEVATIETTKYISDLGERIFPAPRRTGRNPPSFSDGIFGFLFSLLSKKI